MTQLKRAKGAAVQVAEQGCVCGRYAAVTETAALASSDWIGRGDGVSAGTAAREAMAVELQRMPVRGRVVAGRSGGPSCGALKLGDEVGRESGPWLSSQLSRGRDNELWSTDPADVWDLAIDPLQAPTLLARGSEGAFAMMAAGPGGSLLPVPEMYMEKLIVPQQAVGAVDLDAPVDDIIKGVAAALGVSPEELSVVVLDRPRHEDLIAQIRRAGARIRLISDGDVSAALAVASGVADVNLYIGIGGSTEGVLAAAALRCLGGEIQARFWPVSRHQVKLMEAAGIHDLEARLSTADMAGDGVLFVATAVTGNRFLRGVSRSAKGIHTETLVLCSRCGAVRKIATVHRL